LEEEEKIIVNVCLLIVIKFNIFYHSATPAHSPRINE